MDCLATASAAAKIALEQGRIGTPVAIRIVLSAAEGREDLESVLGRGLEASAVWLGEEPQRLAALGGTDRGQISVLATFRGGQTALVCAGPRGQSDGCVDLTIMGTRGALAWQSRAEPDGFQNQERPMSPTARRLLEQAQQACVSAEPATELKQAISPTAPRVRTQPPYGILLVGGAHTHQENYAPLFAADRRCRLVGVSDEIDVPQRRRDLNAQLARTMGIPHLPDLNEALARGDVHVVSVCAEPERRGRVAIRCAEAGKHLYLDKPMAASAEEAEAVVAAARGVGVVSQMFSTVRSSVGTRLREALNRGTLGEPLAIHLHLTFAKGPAGTARLGKPRTESPQPLRFETINSKREVFNVGVYPLVLLQWLFHRPVRRVWAATGNYFFAEHQANDMEDFGMILLELEGGLAATVTAGRTGWRSHPMAGFNRTTIMGSRSVIQVDLDQPRWDAWTDECPWLPPRIHPQDPMGFWKSTMAEVEALPKQSWVVPPEETDSDVSYFLDCVQQCRASDVPAELAASVVRVLLAAYRSAAMKEPAVP